VEINEPISKITVTNNMDKKTLEWKKYLLVFVITSAIFFTAIFISNYFGQKKIEELRSIQNQISINILSSEIQTSLLEQFSCKDVSGTALSEELGSLGDKLVATESTRGITNLEVVELKRYYSLLQIKDFVLMNKVREKCGTKNVFIIYFYTQNCGECQKQGYVLTKLREDFPQLRVYSFDYNLDLSAIKTLISINKVKNTPPALLIDDNIYYGFKSIDDINEIIPQLDVWQKEMDKQKTASTTETAVK